MTLIIGHNFSNDLTVLNLLKLHDEVIKIMKCKYDKFTIETTGGGIDRIVDFKYRGVTRDDIIRGLKRTDFPTECIKDNYGDGHTHVALPNSPYYRNPPKIENRIIKHIMFQIKNDRTYVYKGGIFEEFPDLNKKFIGKTIIIKSSWF